MNYRELKTKKAWKRVLPDITGQVFSADGYYSNEPQSINDTLTQRDFQRERYPSGHKINSPAYYPDIYREEKAEVLDDSGAPTGRFTTRIYKESVPRYSFAFQEVILIKQLIHLCGNDIQSEFAFDKASEADVARFLRLKGGWLMKDMETNVYKYFRAIKATADGAMVFFMDKGKLGVKVLDYDDGYTLYPHYDNFGKLCAFGYSYNAYDESGNITTDFFEVYDNEYQYVLKQGVGKNKSFKEKILGLFNIDGYTLVSKQPHGFNRVPVAYKRCEEGPCWWRSQSVIDAYELSFSQMAHNNQAFAFPILTLQGEDVEALHDINGTIKMLTMGTDDKAGFISANNASEAFMKQLDTLERLIYELSFAVKPPELKSGDLPAAALKILYSPAYEKAIADAAEFQDTLNDIVSLFIYGYGMEIEDTIGLDNLDIKWWIKPYVHINWSTTIADLAAAVQNGFLSRQTASERIQEYATVGEWEQILLEQKQKQQDALQAEIAKLQATAQKPSASE